MCSALANYLHNSNICMYVNEMKNRLFSIAIFLRILQWTILMCELTTNCFDSLCMYRSAVWQEEVWVSEPGEIGPTVRVNTDQIRGESMLTLNTYQHVPTRANTSKMYQYVPICTNMYQHVKICTNKYQHILIFTTHTNMYQHIPTCTNTYQHIPTHTNMYQYILAHTNISQYV